MMTKEQAQKREVAGRKWEFLVGLIYEDLLIFEVHLTLGFNFLVFVLETLEVLKP